MLGILPPLVRAHSFYHLGNTRALSASYGGPANFSGRLHASADGWKGTGDLEFMNDWTYKLGEEGETWKDTSFRK